MDILSGNPAAKVELPRLNSYTASYYNEKELKKLFELVKGIQAWLGHSTISTTANIYVHQEFASKINSANAILQILPMDKKESEQA